MTRHPVLDIVVLDCPDALALSAFYSELLGWPAEEGGTQEWVTLVADSSGGRIKLGFQRIDDYAEPTWPGGERPQQFHLDLHTDDMDADQQRALELGARLHDHQPAEEDGFRVFLDPAGHPFCLCR